MSKKKPGIDKGLLSQIHPASWTVPVEMPVKVKKGGKSLVIGVPKETGAFENRVPLTPETVSVLVANGHEVHIQQGAGVGASFSDKAYADVGAIIAYSVEDVFTKAEFIIKISPLNARELELLRNNQTLMNAVNLGSLTPDYLQVLIKKNITAIGFEFLEASDGERPLVQSMSEIAGVTSVHIASELLSGIGEGKGILLGGISGVPPAVVTIIGAGTVGINAARAALGMGAQVKIIDNEVHKLRQLENVLAVKVFTAVAQSHYIEEAVRGSDVVIGAAFKAGYRTPVVVTEEMVAGMKEGSVIVDVAIDQGGCVETSRLTSHQNPTYTYQDVIHYCVPNIASRVANTASTAVSNIIGPMLVDVGDFGGIDMLIRYNEGVKEGIYVYRRHLTKQPISSLFGIDYMNIEMLMATDLD